MNFLLIVLLIVLALFAFVILFGAPYVPTLKKQTKLAVDLLELSPGQRLLELGCGDGRVMREAASRGIICVGYELNPLLATVAFVTTYKYRKLVTVKCANYWSASWPPTDGIYVFLLEKYMKKLDNKIIQQQYKNEVKLVSFAFRLPGKKPVKKISGLFVYEYTR